MQTTSLSVLVTADKSTSFRILGTSLHPLPPLAALPSQPPPSRCPGLDRVLDGPQDRSPGPSSPQLVPSLLSYAGARPFTSSCRAQGGGGHCTSFLQLWWSEGQTVTGLVLLSGRFLHMLRFLLQDASAPLSWVEDGNHDGPRHGVGFLSFKPLSQHTVGGWLSSKTLTTQA